MDQQKIMQYSCIPLCLGLIGHLLFYWFDRHYETARSVLLPWWFKIKCVQIFALLLSMITCLFDARLSFTFHMVAFTGWILCNLLQSRSLRTSYWNTYTYLFLLSREVFQFESHFLFQRSYIRLVPLLVELIHALVQCIAGNYKCLNVMLLIDYSNKYYQRFCYFSLVLLLGMSGYNYDLTHHWIHFVIKLLGIWSCVQMIKKEHREGYESLLQSANNIPIKPKRQLRSRTAVTFAESAISQETNAIDPKEVEYSVPWYIKAQLESKSASPISEKQEQQEQQEQQQQEQQEHNQE